MQTLNFKISGMSCGGCSMKVEHRVAKLSGVQSVVVDLRPGFAKVEIDPDRVTLDQIVAVIAEAGFTATVVAAP